MKITLCQINTTVGDLDGNTEKIVGSIKSCIGYPDIFIFPELSISGYPPLDLVDNTAFINAQLKQLDKILEETKEIDSCIVLGVIEKNPDPGKNLFNSAVVCYKGKIIYRYRKRLLPTYDVFDEARYFEPGKEMGLFSFNGKRIGIVICEDLWYDNKLYTINPAKELFHANADFVLSLNASPSVVGKYHQKVSMIRKISKKYSLPIIYVNQVGGNDDIVFDGGSFVTSSNGSVSCHADMFKEHIVDVDMDKDLYINIHIAKTYKSDPEFFYEQAKCGIIDYVTKCGFKGVVIGESGGIDSAVVTALAADALGGDKVTGITMPSQYSSIGSYVDSERLCDNFGVPFHTYPIKEAFDTILEKFNSEFNPAVPGLTEENLQARIRGQILMAYSNRYGHLVLSTGNKSELSVGYCVMGESYIRNSLGLLTASELFEELPINKVTYLGNSITNGFQSVKKVKYTVVTEIGNELSTSNDHEYKIYDPIKKIVMFKKAKEISVGDILILKIGSNIWGTKTNFPDFKYEKKKWDYKSFEFRPPKKLTQELGIFLGICIADGSYADSYRIRSSKQYVADFCLNVLCSMGLPKSCYKQTCVDENGSFFIEISSVQFLAWLSFIGIKHGSLVKDVPLIIRQSPKEIVQAFIGGLMLDSSANNKKDRAEITYRSSSILLARQVHYIFLNMGVLCFFRVHDSKKHNTSYEIYIPPYETHKLAVLPIIKKTVTCRIDNNKNPQKIKSVLDYIYNIEEEIRYIKNMVREDQRATLRRALNKPIVKIGRITIEKYVRMLPEDDPIRCSLLKKITSDEYLIPCSSVRKETGEFIMYDFSVEHIHEFNANGIDVHNCTMYGDMCGGLAPISDLYKMEVYAIAKHINALHGKEMIPQAIIDKEPSAELAPGQRDVDSLPPYPVLDCILKLFIEGEVMDEEEKRVCTEIVNQNNAYIDQVLNLIRRAEFKRRQATIGIKMHKKAFGFGRRIPIAQKWSLSF